MSAKKSKLTAILALTILVSCNSTREVFPLYFNDEGGCFMRQVRYSRDFIGFISESEQVEDHYCQNTLGHSFNDYLEVMENLELSRLRCLENEK